MANLKEIMLRTEAENRASAVDFANFAAGSKNAADAAALEAEQKDVARKIMRITHAICTGAAYEGFAGDDLTSLLAKARATLDGLIGGTPCDDSPDHVWLYVAYDGEPDKGENTLFVRRSVEIEYADLTPEETNELCTPDDALYL